MQYTRKVSVAMKGISIPHQFFLPPSNPTPPPIDSPSHPMSVLRTSPQTSQNSTRHVHNNQTRRFGFFCVDAAMQHDTYQHEETQVTFSNLVIWHAGTLFRPRLWGWHVLRWVSRSLLSITIPFFLYSATGGFESRCREENNTQRSVCCEGVCLQGCVVMILAKSERKRCIPQRTKERTSFLLFSFFSFFKTADDDVYCTIDSIRLAR